MTGQAAQTAEAFPGISHAPHGVIHGTLMGYTPDCVICHAETFPGISDAPRGFIHGTLMTFLPPCVICHAEILPGNSDAPQGFLKNSSVTYMPDCVICRAAAAEDGGRPGCHPAGTAGPAAGAVDGSRGRNREGREQPPDLLSARPGEPEPIKYVNEYAGRRSSWSLQAASQTPPAPVKRLDHVGCGLRWLSLCL